MEDTTNPPSASDYTPLSAHQSQTPPTFFAAKPVLHLHAIGTLTTTDTANASLQNLTGQTIDIWVTSRHLILFSTAQSFGLKIPYPVITVTAQDGKDVLLELNLSDADTADEDIEFLQMRLTAEKIERHEDAEERQEQASEGAGAVAGTNGTTSNNDISTALFKAISECQELNPDPRGDDDEDGEGVEVGFDETAPGATGWITSENMGDYVDEEGNFRMPAGMSVVGGEGEGESLGAGAGTTRTAAEVDGDGEGDEEEERKWQRTG